MHCDISSADAYQAAVVRATAEFGRVDCVLNSAVKMAPGMLVDLSLESWNTMLTVGLTGTFLMTQAAGRWMIDNQTKGSIVTMSSVGGHQPYGNSDPAALCGSVTNMDADQLNAVFVRGDEYR